MKLIAILLLIASVPLGAFAWWGLYTPAGRRRYDEMDALYPAMGGIAGIVLLLAAIVLLIVIYVRSS